VAGAHWVWLNTATETTSTTVTNALDDLDGLQDHENTGVPGAAPGAMPGAVPGTGFPSAVPAGPIGDATGAWERGRVPQTLALGPMQLCALVFSGRWACVAKSVPGRSLCQRPVDRTTGLTRAAEIRHGCSVCAAAVPSGDWYCDGCCLHPRGLAFQDVPVTVCSQTQTHP